MAYRSDFLPTETEQKINAKLIHIEKLLHGNLITLEEAQYIYLTYIQSLNLTSNETFNIYTNTTITK